MAAGLFLLIVVGVIVVVALIGYGAATRDSDKRELKSELRTKSQQLRLARRALGLIGSGTAGNPTAEAQIALDEIDNLEMKELT